VQRFSNFLAWKNHSVNSVYPEKHPTYEYVERYEKTGLLMRGDHSNIANFRAKF
jgi:hypothetical protein